MRLQHGQNLFNALDRVADFSALQDEMTEIVMAVEKDNSDVIALLDDYDELVESSNQKEAELHEEIEQLEDKLRDAKELIQDLQDKISFLGISGF
ncbi:MAG: hypothetical protein AAF740_10310 [Bacteroidota bacterium]